MNPYTFNTKKEFNWSNILDGTQKVLGIINQTIPIIYQVKPIINNLKIISNLTKIMNESSEDKKTNKKSTIFYT